jgi:phage/plasmid-like protein (TIGR03299 family)
MAHQITKDDNMVSTKNLVPWHGLGTVLPDNAITAADAIKYASLGWEVECLPVFNADMKPIDGFRGVTRKDTGKVFAMVGEGYSPLQNTILAELAEAVVSGSDGKAAFETAGSLRGGETVWFLLNVGDKKLGANDVFKNYVMFTNSHSAKSTVRAYATSVRIVCANTFNAAVAEGTRAFSVRHTKNMMHKIKTSFDVLQWSNEATDATFAIYRQMQKHAMSADNAKNYIDTVFGVTDDIDANGDRISSTRAINNAEQVFDLFRNGAGNEGKTAYDIFNAFTDYVDHSRSTRVSDGDDRSENTFSSSVFGSGDALKQKVFGQLEAMTA